MMQYDLYGARGISLDELQQAVGPVMNLSFQRRYNDEIGTYYKAEFGEEVFSVDPNYLEDDNEEAVWVPEFAEYPVLLRVDRTERGDEIRGLLAEIAGLDFLRRKTL